MIGPVYGFIYVSIWDLFRLYFVDVEYQK